MVILGELVQTMEEDYNMDSQDTSLNEQGNRGSEGSDNLSDSLKDFGDQGYDEAYEDEDGGNNFRNNRGRGNFRNRGRGPHPNWMNGPPGLRYRGRGYGPGGPPMRGRSFFRTRNGPRFSNTPNYEGSWGPMGPPPPGMNMGGPPPYGPPPPGMMGGPMGPPPNMMGQPPPFQGPPGMPPPNMPSPELWVEAKSEDGKPYYYHARTRETTWTRPQETPNCKIISQQEMEALAAAGQIPGMAQTMQMNGPMGGMPPGMMPNGMMQQMMPPGQMPPGQMPPGQQQQQGGVPPFMTQPPPWVTKDATGVEGMKQDEGIPTLNPMESDETPPGEAPLQQMPTATIPGPGNSFSGPGPNFSNAPPSFNAGAAGHAGMQQMQNMGPPPGPPGGPPGGFPGAWGGWGGWPPPLVANPPPNLGNAAMPDNGGNSQKMSPATAPSGLNADKKQMESQTGRKEIVTSSYPSTVLYGDPKPGSKKPMRRRLEPLKKPLTTIPPELQAQAAEWTSHKAPDGRLYYYHAGRQESVWEKPKPVKELEELQAKIQAEKDRAEKLAIIKDKEIKKNLDIIDVEAHEQEKAAAEAKAIADKEREAQEEKEREERERAEKEKAEREKVEKEKAEKEKVEKEKEKTKADKSRPISSTPISGTPWCVVWTGDGRVFFYNPTAHSSVWERPPQLVGRVDVDRAIGQPPSAVQDLQQKKEPAAAAAGKAANGELKRAADSDSDDSDAEPIKKAKGDDSKKAAAQIEPGKEAAIEAEVRAARERGVVPHEQRLRSFQAMLLEKQVSAFSTWEKELHKIVFDPRYLLLNSKERRQVFDQYVRDRAEEERKEKKNRLLQKKLTFRTLLEEAKLHSKSSFTEFASKHGRDERFKSIEKARERELYFNEYILEVRKKEKEDKEKKREQAKLEFFALLKEKGIDRHARFGEVKKKIDTEPRYKAVEGGAAREDCFREYCKQLKDDRRKDKDAKERDRSSKKEKKEKDREKEKEAKETKKEKKKEKGEAQTEEERKQPTPPPDQWAEILGIPGEEARARASKKALESASTSEQSAKSSEEEMPSPKQLRSSKKEAPTPEKTEKVTIKSPPKKRKLEEFMPPEPEKKAKKKTEKKAKAAADKTEKKKRKKSEKD